MQDERIVELYWSRDEQAIRETERKYGRYLTKIASHILHDPEDSEEIVNDTYRKAWESMPPHRPGVLSTYLVKITRRLSIDRFRYRSQTKRQAGEYAMSLDELSECVSGGDTTAGAVEARLLADAVSAYLLSLRKTARAAFVCRYFYMDPIPEIAARCGMSQAAVKSMLHRTRLGLRDYLKKEGFDL